MSIRSRLFALPMPGFARRACIGRLTRLTADAFGVEAPAARGSAAQLLERYAAFTREQAEGLLQDGARVSEVRERLHCNARSLGSALRSSLGIRSTREALEAARALYRLIGVDFRGSAGKGGCAWGGPGSFAVASCYFSRQYPPAVCRLISSLDAGLLFGLTGGKAMSFTARITEGAGACAGVLT